MRHIKTLICLIFIVSNSFAQDMGVHFGHQIYGVLNAKQPLHGISIGLDIPRTGFVTPYGQVSIFLPNRDFFTVGDAYSSTPGMPDIFGIRAISRANTYSAEFGTIYYMFGAYDYGFSVMMHNSLRVLFAPTKLYLEDFDDANYTFSSYFPNFVLNSDNGFKTSYNALVVNIGLGLGLKYSFDWGSVYAMAGLELFTMGERRPHYYYDENDQWSVFSYSTRIGVRRELDFSKSSERKQIRENNRRERQKW